MTPPYDPPGWEEEGGGTAVLTTDPRLSDQRVPSDGSVSLVKLASGLLVPKSMLGALGIVDADVASGAAIAESKLALASDAAAGTASRRTLGTGATQAAAGNDARLSDQRTPSDNSVTSAKIADGAIVNADVNASAAIAQSKLALPGNAIASGIETMPRTSGLLTAGWVSQRIQFSFFTATQAVLLTNAIACSGGTAAAATPSLIRIGLYTVSGTTLTLVASTPNDTSLFAAANTAYTKALSATYTTVPEQRYAAGLLIISAATMPSIFGLTFNAGTGLGSLTPKLCTHVSSLNDIPSPTQVAGQSDAYFMPWIGFS